MGLSHTVSEIIGNFVRKLKFFHIRPVYLAFPLCGFPLEFGNTEQCQETRMMGLSSKFDDIFSRLDIAHERDRQTDRRTDGQT